MCTRVWAYIPPKNKKTFSKRFMNRLALLGFCLAYLRVVSSVIDQITVSLPDRRPFRQLRDDYVSIESSCCCSRAIELGRQLQPAQLRFGGNDADRMLFDGRKHKIFPASLIDESCIPTPNKNMFYMSRKQFDRLNWFASSVGWRLIFDLNALIRTHEGQYNTSAAEVLLNYASGMNYSMDFELGNEPNSFYHKFGESVNGSQLAADYAALRHLLRRYPLFAKSRLIGPSITQPDKKSKIKYLNQFLKAGGYKSVDALTWHQYYVNGRTASLDQFLNSTIFDALAVEMRTMQQRTRHYTHQTDFSIWMGETASAYGGGAPGLSDTYVGGFMWLDKLGMGAVNGIDLIVRQSFFNGYYALINQQSLPNPDYWLTLLFKRLVGPGVLHVTATPQQPDVRIYAHCDKRRVTIYAMNLKKNDVRLTFSEYAGPVDFYEYAPLSGNLTDAQITINGRAPSFHAGSVRMPLKPIKSRQPLLLKSFRVIFVVLPLNDVKCAL